MAVTCQPFQSPQGGQGFAALGASARGTAPAPQPGQLGQRERAAQAQGRLTAEVAGHLHGAGGRPGREYSGGQQAAGGKAGFLGGGAALFEYGDGVAVLRQFIRGGDADNAGAHDGYLHEFREFLASSAMWISASSYCFCSVSSIRRPILSTASSCSAACHTISPTGSSPAPSCAASRPSAGATLARVGATMGTVGESRASYPSMAASTLAIQRWRACSRSMYSYAAIPTPPSTPGPARGT